MRMESKAASSQPRRRSPDDPQPAIAIAGAASHWSLHLLPARHELTMPPDGVDAWALPPRWGFAPDVAAGFWVSDDRHRVDSLVATRTHVDCHGAASRYSRGAARIPGMLDDPCQRSAARHLAAGGISTRSGGADRFMLPSYTARTYTGIPSSSTDRYASVIEGVAAPDVLLGIPHLGHGVDIEDYVGFRWNGGQGAPSTIWAGRETRLRRLPLDEQISRLTPPIVLYFFCEMTL